MKRTIYTDKDYSHRTFEQVKEDILASNKLREKTDTPEPRKHLEGCGLPPTHLGQCSNGTKRIGNRKSNS
jgi:hypothetical protein